MSDGHEDKRPLEGLALGISISASEDAPALGFEGEDINKAVLRVAAAVIAQGGHVVFGHDWRPDGVMAAVFGMALDYKDSTDTPIIRNFVPWPNTSSIGQQDRARYGEVLEIIETRPEGLARDASPSLEARVHSLSHMRRRLAEASDARICIGGRVGVSGGLCSGIVEEAALSLQAGKPLYLTGLFGGASAQVIDAVLDQPLGEASAFRTRPDVAEALGYSQDAQFGISPEVFTELGLEGLSALNGLSAEENQRLFEATNLDTVIGYVLLGLGRMKR